MIEMFRNMRVLTQIKFRNYCAMNDNEDLVPKTKIETKIKPEEKIQTIISMKKKEYQELMKTQSLEKEEVCKQIKIIESRLKKMYGFNKNEDLTVFPVFTFNDPKIDNQLDDIKIPK